MKCSYPNIKLLQLDCYLSAASRTWIENLLPLPKRDGLGGQHHHLCDYFLKPSGSIILRCFWDIQYYNYDYFTIVTIIGPTINRSDASPKSMTYLHKGIQGWCHRSCVTKKAISKFTFSNIYLIFEGKSFVEIMPAYMDRDDYKHWAEFIFTTDSSQGLFLLLSAFGMITVKDSGSPFSHLFDISKESTMIKTLSPAWTSWVRDTMGSWPIPPPPPI